jgi:uncharacterized protein
MTNAAYDKPQPEIDDVSRPYWENNRLHRLSVQRCDDCGDRHFPPSPVCPACLSERQSWEIVSGRGTLVSWVRFHRAYWAGFRDQIPYDVCLVRLDEGPLVLSNFHGPTPERPKAGMAVRVVFDDVTAELTLPRFVLA